MWNAPPRSSFILSILNTNPKLLINILDAHTSLISNHAHQALPHVANLVVVVEELYVVFYCEWGGGGVSVGVFGKYGFGGEVGEVGEVREKS